MIETIDDDFCKNSKIVIVDFFDVFYKLYSTKAEYPECLKKYHKEMKTMYCLRSIKNEDLDEFVYRNTNEYNKDRYRDVE